MVLPDIETHIGRIEFFEKLDGLFHLALDVRSELLKLRGTGQASLEKDREITLERRCTRAKKTEFIADVCTLLEATLGTRDFDEAKEVFTGLETEPNSFPNAMRRQDAISHLLRRGVGDIPGIIENSR